MEKKEKLFWIIAVILIIIITSIMMYIIIDKNETQETINTNIIQNEVDITNEVDEENNENENNIIIEENNEFKENIIQVYDEEKNKNEETQETSEEITKEEVENIKNNDEKAIEIAKKDWGEDTKVVFVNDSISKSTGRYIVAVRDAKTRNAICYYHIDINTGEFKVEN